MSLVQERCDRRASGSRSEKRRLAPWIKLGVAGMLLSTLFLAGCSGVAGANPSSPAPSPAPQLSIGKTSLAFGNVQVGSTSTQSVTLTNTGNAALSISQVSVSGAPFQTSGITAPTSLAAGQSTVLSVTFAPSSAGSFTGSVSVTSNASNSPANVALSGSGVAFTFQLTASPISLSFGNVTVGNSASQTVMLTNTGNSSVTISQISVSGAPFQTSGITAPTSLAAGQSTVLSVTFAPSSAGSFTGSVSVTSNASNSPANVALSGSGVASTFQLTASPISLSFGNVTVGNSASQTVMLTNTGNSSVTISQVSASGAGFSTTGLAAPVNLAAGQGASFSVVFAPAAGGAVTGSVSIVSNASNSPAIVTLSGSGAQAVAHSVSLAWDPSTSVVIGYNVYRATQNGGPYSKINASPLATTTYTDNSVQSGLTYFYVTTAVDSTNIESIFSNQVSVTIPIP